VLLLSGWLRWVWAGTMAHKWHVKKQSAATAREPRVSLASTCTLTSVQMASSAPADYGDLGIRRMVTCRAMIEPGSAAQRLETQLAAGPRFGGTHRCFRNAAS